MSSLFGSKPKPNVALQRSQRLQAQSVEKQTSEAAREAGGRSRLAHQRRVGGGTLFARTGGAGVTRQATLG